MSEHGAQSANEPEFDNRFRLPTLTSGTLILPENIDARPPHDHYDLIGALIYAATGMPGFYLPPRPELPVGESAARRALPWGDSAYTSMVVRRWIEGEPPEPGGVWCMGPPANGLTPSSEGERRRDQAEFRRGIVGGRDYVASCLRTAAILDGDPLFYPDDYTIGDRFTPSDLDPDLWTNPVTARPYGVAGPALREGDPVGWVDEAGELHTDTWPAPAPVQVGDRAADRIRAALDFVHAMGVEPYHYPREDAPVTIVQFIEARLSEDEQQANEAATPARIPVEGGVLEVGDLALQGPALEVLRRCVMIRAMLRHAAEVASKDETIRGEFGDADDLYTEAAMHRDIAAYWNTHPEYRAEWNEPTTAPDEPPVCLCPHHAVTGDTGNSPFRWTCKACGRSTTDLPIDARAQDIRAALYRVPAPQETPPA